ncbi:MAG: carboxylesterase family protein, partial [Kordiimonadaceae bacterium]|nr:carboxylesterase family protein [Kordiimonadaceae bacterium]
MKKIAKKLALYIGLSIGVVIIGGVTWTGTMFYGLDSPKPAVSRNMVEETLRPTVHGAIKGIATTTGMHMWFGIPYAGPVSGENRWTMPSAPEAWSTPKDLTANPEDCYQFGKPFDELPPAGHIGVEDCLTLDVMAPAFKTDEIPTGKDRLPVIVWIHGGGNAIGYPGDLTHNKLVPEENVVVVAPRYRLGPFGWFSHAAVRETGVQTANFGLEDLIYSLRWVQENIAEFGGDPENITLVGESAGGVNIFSLILSPRAKGLFHKTIMQSGVSFTTTRSSAENRETDTIPGRLNNSADIVA